MSNKVYTLNGAKGISNVADIVFKNMRPIEYLRTGTNIDVSADGDMSLRPGMSASKYTSTGLHSLDPNGSGLFMQGSVLKRLRTNYTAVTIATMSNSNAMVYAKIPGKGTVCSNNTDIGIVNEDNFSGFSNPGVQYKRAMPSGHILAMHKGVLYVARGADIYYSDAHAYGVVDIRNKKKRMKSYVTMIQPVDDGLYISDSNDTFFASGNNPHELTVNKIADYPAIYGINISVEEQLSAEGYSVFWQSTQGVCSGKNGGEFVNLTLAKYANTSDTPQTGCALFRYNNGIPQFIAVGNI